MTVRCLCLVCGDEWSVEHLGDDGPNGHRYGESCPCAGPPRLVFVPSSNDGSGA